MMTDNKYLCDGTFGIFVRTFFCRLHEFYLQRYARLRYIKLITGFWTINYNALLRASFIINIKHDI